MIAKQAPDLTCKVKVDVGFVLDSSGSMRNDYDKEKDFLKALAATFGVSETGSRVGVVTFSYYTKHSVKLSDHTDLASFNDAVDKIPLMGSTTRIDKALRLTQDKMFSTGNGGRPGVSKILIVLTDGSQTPDAGAEDPGVVAEELRDSGITVLAVGIGKGVNRTELAHIAGEAKNAYSAATFDELISREFLDKLNTAGCVAAKKASEPTCKAKVDVGFVVDSSGSMRNDYDKEKDFLKALVATFGLSEIGSRAGVVTYSYYTEHSVKLSDHTDLASFNDAVDKIPLMGSTTRIDKALRLTQMEMFSTGNGGRPGVSKILIVLTDGSQTPDAGAEDPGVVAEELRDSGITVLAVGIGKGVNRTELAHIAGEASNVYFAATFDELISREFLDKLNTAGCVAGPTDDFKHTSKENI